MKKVIFLDFDGVLNNYYNPLHARRCLSPIYIGNLNSLLSIVPDVKIVISSTWRIIRDLKQLKDVLALAGFKHPHVVIDTTPRISGSQRGQEIDQWLSDNKDVLSFVILDDDSDMDPHMDHLVKTNGYTGLTKNDVTQAASILSNA